MLTRRQVIRWAEVWLSCWNDRDLDTLLALHSDDARVGGTTVSALTATRADRKRALERHWAALPYGLHSGSVELDEVVWDPESREIAILYVADVHGIRLRGCDHVTLDGTGRMLAGEPLVGSLTEEPRARVQSHVRDWILTESGGGR